MSATTPPSPIWSDEATGLAIWVYGGLISFTSLYSIGRRSVLPSEAADLGAEFSAALAEAASWADRWDIVTGCYAEAD